MIPKVIHYCWFGGNPLPETAIKCIESWKKFCPDYEIKQWSEENYDINKIQYVKEAYQEKKYAFVTDVARLDIIYHEGGIYLDTDVEIIKSLDQLLDNSLYLGMETTGRVNTGLGFGAEPKHKFVKDNLNLYADIPFVSNITCVTYTTNMLKRYGLRNRNELQQLGTILVLPTEYLCPLILETNRLKITENTYSIHHYDMSWKDKKDRLIRFKIMLRRWLGDFLYDKMKQLRNKNYE
jgi:mannosyltransferase OCH1-like enzyme